MDGTEMVTVPFSKYESMVRDSEFLSCLQAAGVDNWEGYGEARGMMEEEEEDEE
jgi:hypothetical protein